MKTNTFSNAARHFAGNIWAKCLSSAALLTLVSSQIFAQSDGLPRGAYQMPYTRYEAESGNYGSGAKYYEDPEFLAEPIAAEASDQKYVGLPSNGSYVQWSVNKPANGVTMRFTMPDAAGGEGQNGSLDVYVNGSKVKTVDLTSYWAWQYFPGQEPEDHPGDRPRMRFDEVHFILDNALSAGDVLKIQKSNADSFEYGVDFVELEEVEPAIQKPAGYVSVTEYGAIANDNNDDLAAFQAALSAAQNAGTGLYIPEGRFMLSQKFVVETQNIAITGAGMWYTEIYFSTEAVFSGGILGRCSNMDIGNFYLNTVNNQRFLNGQYVTYKGFMGTYGSNSSIHDVWITHFECGAWIAGYDPPYPIDVTTNLEFTRNRIRNNYADGINLCQGTSNATVSHCNFRSNGDDAMAVWPNSDFSAPEGVNNIFKYNTVEHTYRAAGAAIFGGNGHEVHHCIIKDNFAGSGIRLTTDFPGYHFENTTAIRIYENTIIGCGTSNDLWDFERGAIEINATNYPIQNVFFENIDIINAQRHGIQIGSTQSVNANFDNISINGTGLDPYTDSRYTIPLEGAAVMVFAGQGTSVFNNLSMQNIERDPAIYQSQQGYNLVIQNENIPLTGISLPQEEVNMVAGATQPLSVSFSPANATNKTVTWSSSNNSVATYDAVEGQIVAHGTGSATLTVTSEQGGFSDQVTVNVVAAVNIVASDDAASESGDVGTFTISIAEIAQNINVNYSIEGTASSSDYVASPALTGSLTLSPSSLSRTITITPNNDSDFEGAETLTLTLQPGSGYQLGGTTSATINIADNDNPPCSAPNIGLTDATPAIDGNIDAVWNQLEGVSISNTTIGSLPNDFNGSYKAMFDNNNLYLLVQASDNSLNNDSGGEWWNDDVMNIFIDGNNSKGTSYDGLNDFQLGFRWNDNTIHVGDNSVQNTTGIQHSMFATSNGYALEVAIPWSTIGVTPTVGNAIGIDVIIDDDDAGGSRDAQVAAFSTTDMAWSNPSLFGSVFLTTCGEVVVANAGADITLPKGSTSTSLDGSASSGPGSLTYAWSQLDGPNATIANANNATANVSGLTNGTTYTFQLAVSSEGTTVTDIVVVKVGSNQAPTVNAGSNVAVQLPNNTATLSASANDEDGDIASYTWEQTAGPSTANLSANNTANISISELIEGAYTFKVTVIDNDGASASDEVQVTVSTEPDMAQDRGYYDAAYTRYESESGTFGNGAAVVGPSYDMAQLASEATDRKFVSLNNNGSYVQWTVNGQSQDGLTLRFSLPDNATGSLALYVNGSKVRDISLSSYWAWQYFDVSPSTNGTPSNNPQGGNPEPRMRFDEVHFQLNTPLNNGDVVKIQKDNGDNFSYAVDFIELETIPGAIAQPAGYLNIMDYGATPNDESNDAQAFRTCLDLANGDPSIKGIYIPAGRFINGQGNGSPSGNIWIPNDGITIQGAGMWHTEVYFSSTSENGAGFLFDANNVHIKDFYMNSATNSRIAGNKAINGSLGSGSTISNVWAEHFETGFWISSMQSNGWNVTDGLVISNCRIRNVYADGVNLAKGTRNTTVEHTSFRNCIDDAMAVWSVNYLEAVPPTPSVGNIFRYNTVENNLRAAGLGFFGGHSHEAHHLLIKDNFAGPGIRLNTQFPAYPFGSNSSEAINIHDVTVIGCGTTKNIWTYRFGAIELELVTPTQGQSYDLRFANFTDIDIINSQHDAVFIHSYMPSDNNHVIDEIYFNNVNINGTGVALDVNNGSQYNNGDSETGGHGIYVANFSSNNTFDGFLQLSNTTFSNIANEDIAYYNNNGDFEVRTGNEPTNHAPTANAGQDQNLSAGTTNASLNGTGADSDGDALSYTWSQTSGPAANITNANAATTSVTGLTNGNVYVFTLTVSDGSLTASDDITITIENADDNGGGGDNATAYHIKNRWQNTYLSDGGDLVAYNTSASGSNFEWVLEDVGEGYQEIKNVATGEYMHIENLTGQVQCTARTSGWYSSKWAVEDAGEGYVRFKNAWQQAYIHVENLQGYAQYGNAYPEWQSAQWQLEPISTVARIATNGNVDEQLTVYPNPASKEISLTVKGKLQSPSRIIIYDVTGNLVKELSVNESNTNINIENLKSGVYMLKYQSSTKSEMIRLIVE